MYTLYYRKWKVTTRDHPPPCTEDVIVEITKKSNPRFYFLRKLKKASLSHIFLLWHYCECFMHSMVWKQHSCRIKIFSEIIGNFLLPISQLYKINIIWRANSTDKYVFHSLDFYLPGRKLTEVNRGHTLGGKFIKILIINLHLKFKLGIIQTQIQIHLEAYNFLQKWNYTKLVLSWKKQ